MVISTGITLPRMDSVWALYALQKSMMLTPCGPSAVPTGGAGVAAPAWSCTFTRAAIFFLGGIASCVLLRRTSWSSRAGPALPPGVLLVARATGPFWSLFGSDVKSTVGRACRGHRLIVPQTLLGLDPRSRL